MLLKIKFIQFFMPEIGAKYENVNLIRSLQ